MELKYFVCLGFSWFTVKQEIFVTRKNSMMYLSKVPKDYKNVFCQWFDFIPLDLRSLMLIRI